MFEEIAKKLGNINRKTIGEFIMGVRAGKDQKLKDAELKLKAEQQGDQLKMRNPDNPLKSAKATDQGSANAINAAVEKDNKAQEKAAKNADKALPETTDELQDVVDDLKEEVKTSADEVLEKKRLADERDADIEARAIELAKKMTATKTSQTVNTIPAVNDPDNHRDCCLKLVKAIEAINRLKSGLTGGDAKDIAIWLVMLTAVKKRAKTFSQLPPIIDVPEGARNFRGLDLECGDNDRENRIYKNEFIGSCQQMIDASYHMPESWLGDKWLDYTKSIIKALS